MRALKREGLTQPVTVLIRGGVYDLKETLAFTQADSGTAACPITYQAHPGERVVLRGGRPVRGWRRWRGNIYQADLEAQGLKGAVFYQLFYKGTRQILARDPNFDPKHPRTGGCVYVERRGPKPPESFVYEDGSIPFDKWRDISQAEVVTTCGRGC